MKYFPFLILFLLPVLQPLFAQDVPLFKIQQDNRIGYINSTGKVVIPAVFYNGGDFSDGLAPVRAEGYFGFIDEAGREVIPATYEYAGNFKQGIARVFKNGMPRFINKKNELVIDTAYSDMTLVGGDMAIVTTKAGAQGLLNMHTRKLLIDTVFGTIESVYNDIAVVRMKGEHPGDIWEARSYAIVDTQGRIVVPFERYSRIGDFNDGVAVAGKGTGENEEDIVINARGEPVFEATHKGIRHIYGPFSEGLARVSLNHRAGRQGKDQSQTYEAFIDTKGKIVFTDSTSALMQNFAAGRSFVTCNDGYYLIDRTFRRVGTDTFSRVPEKGFQDGYALVKKGGKYGVLDSNGVFVVAPGDENILEVGLGAGFFFFSVEKNYEKEYYGIGTFAGAEIMKPVMQDYDRSGFHHGLLRVIMDNKLTYIDQKGNRVWQETQSERRDLQARNIDYMDYCRCSAYSERAPGDLGGFAQSSNYPKRVTASDSFPRNAFAVIVAADIQDTLDGKYKARKVYVVNTTKNATKFGAQDSRLTMIVQAKDPEGIWKDIEYMPGSFCGNSYHTLTLKPGNFWTFSTAVYAGVYPAKFRIALSYLDPVAGKDKQKRPEITIYSNEYEGSVNPAQFWNKQRYLPQGLMDPYWD